MLNTLAIITRGLNTIYPIVEGQNVFLRSFFCKILTLYMVSIQERFKSRAGYSGARTVVITRSINLALVIEFLRLWVKICEA